MNPLEWIVSNAKLLLYGIAAIVCVGAFCFVRGCSYGEGQMDTKWRAEIAAARPVERHRDTVFVPRKPYTGTFQPKTITVVEHNKKIAEVTAQAMELTQAYANKVDSCRAINKQVTAAYIQALQPRLIELETPELGKLILRYFPADSTANIYEHHPPPIKEVIIYRDKLVLEPRSDWETVGYVVLGTTIGGLIMYLAR